MNKLKTICACLLIALIGVAFFTIKKKEEFRQKTVLALEIRKAVRFLMFDLSAAHENTIQDLPADGQWHNHIALVQVRQGLVEYKVKDGYLFRVNNGHSVLIAGNMDDFRIRRQKEAPEIVEVQIKVQKDVSLISNLRIRIHQ